LLRRACDRSLSAADELEEQVAERRLVLRARLRLLGELADDGEHRSLDRAADCTIGGVGGAAKRECGRPRVDARPVRLAEDVGGAADDLREDDAGVSARTHERPARDVACERLPAPGRGALDRVGDRAHGHRQIRPGVAVGNGIDVEVVDTLSARLERGERTVDDLLQRFQIPVEVHFALRTSSMCTSTARTGSPVRRPTSYDTRLRMVDATSARLRPYSTTTCRSIATSSPSRPISMPLRTRSGSHFGPAIATTP